MDHNAKLADELDFARSWNSCRPVACHRMAQFRSGGDLDRWDTVLRVLGCEARLVERRRNR